MTQGKSLVEDMARAMRKARCERYGLSHHHDPNEPADLPDLVEAEAALQAVKDRLPADDRELVERLRKQARCIYIAVEKVVADDVSDALKKAADRIIAYRASRDETDAK